jgi:hypothetical protein
MEKTPGYPYIVDPMTHAFQHNPSYVCGKDGSPKRALKALADLYGEPFSSQVGVHPVQPDMLNDAGLLSSFVRSCLYFQRTRLSIAMAQSEAMRYLEASDVQLRPKALVAPYFFLQEQSLDQWLPLMIRCIEAARAEADFKGEQLYAGVVISKGLLANWVLLTKLCESLSGVDVNGYMVWIDDFSEQKASEYELTCFLKLCRELSKEGRYVLNLHGGYFSILCAGPLGSRAISGVTHSTEFGEHRSVVPVGGGIPISKYYVPELHSRVRYREALQMFQKAGWLVSSDMFHSNVCQCSECRAVLNGSSENFVLFGEGNVREVQRAVGIVRIDYPTLQAKIRCLKHYLNRKENEFRFVANATEDAQLQDLADGGEKYRVIAGLDEVTHLRAWQNVLSANR